jgi:hypothetical protein
VRLILLVLILVSLVVSITVALKTQHMIQILPSLSWINFISIPLFFSWNYFDTEVVQYQFFGVLIVQFAILSTDIFSIRLIRLHGESKIKYLEKLKNGPQFFLLILILGVPAIHYLQVGSFPIFGTVDREIFNKFGAPYIVILLAMLVLSVFMPFILVYAVANKFYFFSILMSSWILIYLYSTGAKGNSYLFLGALLISTALLKGININRLIFIIFLGSFLFIFYSGIHSIGAVRDISKTCRVPIGTLNTPANVLRISCPESNYRDGRLYKKYLDTFGYRVFLTPVEVSYYWYDLTLSDSSNARVLSNLFDRDNEDKFSNKVGLKYYVEKFPKSYGISINANASMDADAFSFKKFYSVVFVSILYSMIRLFIGLSSLHSNTSIRILSGIGLSKLILLPFSAGLQAILVPHGLALIVILILILKSNYAKSIIFK